MSHPALELERPADRSAGRFVIQQPAASPPAVPITPPARSAEFVKVIDNVAIPYLGGEEITIWVGFDTRG